MDINCVLMKYYLMCMIIIQVFQMDIICISIKYYFNIMYFKIILFAF